MKNLTKRMTVSLFCLLAGGAAAHAQVVTIATGAQGSLAYNSGQAVAKVANDVGITARTQPLVGYLPLINNGEVDFGFSNGVEVEYAAAGTGNYDRTHPELRLVGTMFPLTTGLMAPCDLGLKTIADVKAKASELRIASEYTSSTIIPFYIAGGLANGGLTYDDFQKVPVASFVAGIDALGDGLVDIALVSLNAGGRAAGGRQTPVARRPVLHLAGCFGRGPCGLQGIPAGGRARHAAAKRKRQWPAELRRDHHGHPLDDADQFRRR
ncbi:TAXI family TRAP transporter solute-binding subunit [Roseibium salinum]|nr:TAXI family TRAP transporter solute-binding subunit [Roseibium salinum]